MDHTQMKLGKAPPKLDPRTLRLSAYLDDSNLPQLPAEIVWGGKITSWGVMLNDSLGDCTCAAAGHILMSWTSETGEDIVPTDPQILEAYEVVGGYEPGNPSTDNGAVELDVLNYWRKTGIAGRTIKAYVAVNPKNQRHVEEAIYLFGAAYIGLALPISAQNQQPWHLVDGPTGEAGSWGGHAVPIVACDQDGLTCVTWGGLQKMTWDFFFMYCDEAYGVLSADWFAGNDAPNHFDLAQLETDLTALGGSIPLGAKTDDGAKGSTDQEPRTDGPTVEEWVEHGYRADKYPPQGYKSRSSDEDIAKAIAAQVAKNALDAAKESEGGKKSEEPQKDTEQKSS